MSAVDEDVPLVEDVGDDDLACYPRLPGEDLTVHGINGDVVLVGANDERITAGGMSTRLRRTGGRIK